MTSVVQEFHSGFRTALKDLQGVHIFLLTLHQKLDSVLRVFLNITNKISGDCDKDDLVIPESPSHGIVHCPSPPSKERFLNDNHPELSDSDSQRIAQTPRSSSGNKESSDSSSPMSRESWHGKFSKGSGEPLLRIMRLTTKLRDIHKFAKVDNESNKELEQWNEMLRNDVIKLCVRRTISSKNFCEFFFICVGSILLGTMLCFVLYL
ncbi:hypothetical protein OIU76_022437 [Salix suchowensis]|nr:hypothetical protein OIU76_022437 [Salix suchowensis]